MRLFVIALFATICCTSCSSGLPLRSLTAGKDAPWKTPYVDGMNGAENIAFDGAGFMYVTGLNGMLYKISHDEKTGKGRIVKSIKAGEMCLGIAVKDSSTLYVAIQQKNAGKEQACIYLVTTALEIVRPLTPVISGLNGMVLAKDGTLYITSSNLSLFAPSGYIGEINTANEKSFAEPRKRITGGIMNGLALSADEKILYYTETTGSLYSFNRETGKKEKIFEPKGFLQILDDITVAPDGAVWLCFNSEMALVKISGKKMTAYQFGTLKVPSSCAFGKGSGFSDKILYVTEFGLKGRSMTMNGRGVWAIPVYELTD